MNKLTFQSLSKGIPTQPGIYKYYDEHGKLLYVGKAKDLRKRVSNYFLKQQDNFKTAELVRRIDRIECTIVETEQDALLLENSLIKEFKPVFNIDLKDDKTYPFLVIKKEPFPRVFLTRRKINDGSEYIGPFSSAGSVRELLMLVRQMIPLRTCRLNLSEKEISKRKYKVCLEYHLGNCKGPCTGLQSSSDYEAELEQVRNILRGRTKPVLDHLKISLSKCISDLAFEKAAVLQKKIEQLEQYQSRSSVVNPKLGDMDVFGILRYSTYAFIHFLMVRDGSVTRTESIQTECKLDETEKEVLENMFTRIRDRFQSKSPECIVPMQLDLLKSEIKLTVPSGGPKKKLLDMAQTNARFFLNEFKRKEVLLLQKASEEAESSVLNELQRDLHLKETPIHIECFDNSNFQGSYPVSAMVCFLNGSPAPKEYRHYNIKTVEGINDFATMEEVVFRRYDRLLREGKSLPQLIIIDGGKGQLSAAAKSLQRLNISDRVTMIGLAKNTEELFYQGDREPLRLPYQSASLKLIRRIRDEVHRFGVSFHRKKRSAGAFKHELETIPGIGVKTIQLLQQTYRSSENILSKSEIEIADLVGKKKATLIWSYLEQKKKGAG